ncbi:MAG TPA: NapC/NirT family cytochrome c [Thermoanaerobaculia bacterium]
MVDTPEETSPETLPEEEAAPRKAASLARNVTSSIGALIALVALVNIAFLILADVGQEHSNPYIGVLAYCIVPAFLVLGLVLFIVGMLVERRRRRRRAPGDIAEYPDIDLNNPNIRRAFVVSLIGFTTFIAVSLFGSYQAYHYTDSDSFCGTMCHEIMHPEYTAYKLSPHARVGCVNCHIGAGATWYVKSKLSGAYQVYATIANKYPKPVPTPVHNLRPAQETCEQCHWPEKFWGAQLKVFNHFAYDEANTPRETRMLIKTGGGSPSSGMVAGIHWHMNIANEITYLATDEHRQQIAWVRMRNRNTGQSIEYKLADAKISPAQMSPDKLRRMDCVDCHNRPTHIYQPPDRSVDTALLAGRISRTLPYIKQQAVTVLTKDYKSTPEAANAIAAGLRKYYQTTYPDIAKNRSKDLDQAIAAVQMIFQTSRFPEMNVDWRTHPNNVGHFYSQGCFRCHDDNHVSADGKKISKDCTICHTLLGQSESEVVMVQAPNAQFQHPVDLGDLRAVNCSDCHTGSGM